MERPDEFNQASLQFVNKSRFKTIYISKSRQER